MIKLYTHKKLLTPANRGKVHPLLFDLHYFEHTNELVTSHYELVDQIENADVLVFPIDILRIETHQEKEAYALMNAQSIETNKKLHTYTGGDLGKTSTANHIVTWRNAGYRSTNAPATIIIPSFINDPIGLHLTTCEPLPKDAKPQISFTGFATAAVQEQLRYGLSYLKQKLKNTSDFSPDAPLYFNAALKRYKALRQLEKNSDITTRFIYRSKYRAGATSLKERELTTREFFDNLNGSPYTLCMRGAGNFSVRFYEALALGRIPVLIDTDVVLPLENKIDWKSHVCWINAGASIAETLLAFHKKYTDHEFIELQHSNRKLFTDYLVRHKFFYHLKEKLCV